MTADPPPAAPASQSMNRLDGTDPLDLAAYNQNFETFRALNALMWQIPLIAMTLTGGLWFGVSRVESAQELRIGLLTLAVIGDLGLIIVLARLRYILGCYLAWLQAANPRGFVSAPGLNWRNGPETVKSAFQLMLFCAALISVVLLVLAWVC
jgi:hypothetical protein